MDCAVTYVAKDFVKTTEDESQVKCLKCDQFFSHTNAFSIKSERFHNTEFRTLRSGPKKRKKDDGFLRPKKNSSNVLRG